jgi:RNA polymerase sigma-70 factor (family 1)
LYIELLMENDYHLVCCIQKGDSKAFVQLYDKYSGMLIAFSLKYLKDSELAKDAMQTVFMKLWENRENLHDILNIKLYLLILMKNQVLNEIRSIHNRETRESIFVNENQERETVSKSSGDISRVLLELKKAINDLPKQRREIYKLKYESELSNKELSIHMGISENTVKSQYTKLLKTLKEQMLSKKLK